MALTCPVMALTFNRREVARKRNIPTQEFAVRSDMACGSTIGEFNQTVASLTQPQSGDNHVRAAIDLIRVTS